jgi:murein DD-endopeptidase MepM/ murein hydrolase activator NlpD
VQTLTAVVTVLALTVGGGYGGPSSPVSTVRRAPAVALYRAPLAGAVEVLTPFAPPLTPYGPGHLGLDLSASAGAPVLAAGDAVVRFTGQVAGRGVVVLVHPDGISTEYEPVRAVVVGGQRVVAGQRIGTVLGRHRACGPVSCLHWGARRGAAYLDPGSLLEPLGVVRLLPWTGREPDGT